MNFLGQPFYLAGEGGGGGAGGGTGDAVGPGSSTLNAIARFASEDGKTLKDSIVTISDNGQMTGVRAIQNIGGITNSGLITVACGDFLVMSGASSIDVDNDVVINTSGTVSITGRAAPTAFAITGNTVLSGNLAVTGHINTES